MKKIIPFMLMAIISGQSFGQLPKSAETVKVNGINMYYEVYGEGEPLLLLHGWTQSTEFWTEYIPAYVQHFEVYAIDLRGHGKTSQITSDFTIKESAKDILELLDHLKINRVKAIGLSYGGLTLLELARSHPEKIESIIIIGTSHSYNGAENNEGDNAFSYENLPTTFIEELKKIHYNSETQIRALFDPNLNYQINLSDEELNAFNFKTLIIQGDRDEILGVDPAFILYKNIPNSALWIVPNTGHIAIIGPNKKSFLTTSLQFLSLDNK
ncbi:alpha/beta fold hydrolase [Gillisia sp. Q332]|uniref:alpha/beta fold hydrolase n=1 Tax=Gillisia xinjiangensis TaxID=3384765 RepID=UPI00391A1484